MAERRRASILQPTDAPKWHGHRGLSSQHHLKGKYLRTSEPPAKIQARLEDEVKSLLSAHFGTSETMDRDIERRIQKEHDDTPSEE